MTLIMKEPAQTLNFLGPYGSGELIKRKSVKLVVYPQDLHIQK